jgi:radical SAM superfamily enzyme YgiQ (UPF0313 family)
MKNNDEQLAVWKKESWIGDRGQSRMLLQRGYNVKTIDASVEPQLREFYHSYFHILNQHVPENRKGNFYSIGQDVLRNHMMAHINQTDEKAYKELVKMLVYQTFFIRMEESPLDELTGTMAAFYRKLKAYLIGILDKEKPSILGLSLYNGTLPASCFAIKLVKERYPNIKIVLGGGTFADQLAPGTLNMDFFMEKIGEDVDKILIGEGELLFHEYLQGKLSKEKKIYTLEDLGWKTFDIRTAQLPDFSDFDLDIYPNLAAYTSRSCPFQCSFCSETIQWGGYRKKSGKQIVEELTRLYRQYGVQLFYISDPLLNPVLDDLAREFIKSDISLYWDGPLRADKPVGDIENTLFWRRGGFYCARIGLESASDHVLRLMGKKITVNRMQNEVTSLARAGIKTSSLWLIGHPGETEADFQQTLDFLEEYRDYLYDAEATPFWYHLKGQSYSDQWFKSQSHLLYPENAKNMLIAQTWILDSEPSREETYQRLNRFTIHIKKMGIPNPYTLQEIYKADERWIKLHKNAVLPLVNLLSNINYVAVTWSHI